MAAMKFFPEPKEGDLSHCGQRRNSGARGNKVAGETVWAKAAP
jgi:hypothetical protein